MGALQGGSERVMTKGLRRSLKTGLDRGLKSCLEKRLASGLVRGLEKSLDISRPIGVRKRALQAISGDSRDVISLLRVE